MKVLIAKTKELEIDAGKFPEAVREFVFEYGLRQLLNDCGSGALNELCPEGLDGAARKAWAADNAAKIAERKVDLAEEKLAKLYAGELHRTTSAPVTTEHAEARKIARDRIRLAFSREKRDYRSFTALAEADKTAALDALIEQDPSVLDEARKRLEGQRKAAQGVDLAKLGLAAD